MNIPFCLPQFFLLFLMEFSLNTLKKKTYIENTWKMEFSLQEKFSIPKKISKYSNQVCNLRWRSL